MLQKSMLHVALSITALDYKQWEWHVHCFLYEFSLFLNIKYFQSISDNKLNQAFLIYFLVLHGEAYRQNFQPIVTQNQPKFNALVLGLWPTFAQNENPFMKIGTILFQIYPDDKLINKQTNRGKNMISWRM